MGIIRAIFDIPGKLLYWFEKKRHPWTENPAYANVDISWHTKKWYHVIYNTKQYLGHINKVRKGIGLFTAIYVLLYDIIEKLLEALWVAVKISLVFIIISLFSKGTYITEDFPFGEVRAIYHKTSFVMEGDTIVYKQNDKNFIGKVVDTHVDKSFDKKGLTATLEDGTVINFAQVKGIYWGEYTLYSTYKDVSEEEAKKDMGIHGEVDSIGEWAYGMFKYMLSARDDYTMFDRVEVGIKGTYYIGRGLLFRGLALAGLYSS